MANMGQLEQVFLNFIINAEQAMTKAHGGGKLFIKTGLTGGMIRAQVTDNGPGIAAENLGKVLEPFFTTRGNEGGTGLGLSVSYGIINEHGGRLLVRSKPGKGASFIIDLPIMMTKAKNPRETGNKEEPSVGTATGAGVRIIVIDDELGIREVIKRILSSEGYTVEAVSSARVAIEILTRQKFDLILLDIKMPDMDGIELYEQLKEIAPDLLRRVICISGELVSARNKAFLAENRLPYLTKPFGVRDLLEKVATVLGRR
jgi:CheY-like chemotaxis protein